MPSKPGMPDDEDGVAPSSSAAARQPKALAMRRQGMGSPPSDEVGGTAVESVARLIDHEAEAADVIFVGRDEIAPLLGRRRSPPSVATHSVMPACWSDRIAEITIQSEA